MIVKRGLDGEWCASGDGVEGFGRPITVSADTRAEAVKGYCELFHQQQCQEYAFQQSMSHLGEISYGQGAYGEDMG